MSSKIDGCTQRDSRPAAAPRRRARRALNLAMVLVSAGVAATAQAQCLTDWVSGIGTPGTNGPVYSLAALPNGDLIVGGLFDTAGGVVGRNNIARVNPTTGVWSTLGVGTDGIVSALAVMSATQVAVGGDFLNAGGVARPHIASVNPTTGTWSRLIPGETDDAVWSLISLPNGDLILGGNFSSVGGVAANRIGRFTPSSGLPSSLGAGVQNSGSEPSSVYALALMPNGDIIVGGSFTSAGGVAGRNNIARLNPSNNVWTALGPGVTSPGGSSRVSSIVVLPNGELLVGGQFDDAAGARAKNIARYNPTTATWSTLGPGVNGPVFAMTVLPGGDVIVGGSFFLAGGISASRIARYNPTTGVWSALGAGANTTVLSLVTQSSGSVVAGGDFTQAGGAAANRIARFTPGANAPTINLQPLPVMTIQSATAQFGISAVAGFGSSGPLTYQWRKGGVPIDSVANPSAATSILVLTNLQASDAASYSCLVTNSCGGLGTQSTAASLSFVADPCAADFNQDGVADFFDYLDFVAAFSVGC